MTELYHSCSSSNTNCVVKIWTTKCVFFWDNQMTHYRVSKMTHSFLQCKLDCGKKKLAVPLILKRCEIYFLLLNALINPLNNAHCLIPFGKRSHISAMENCSLQLPRTKTVVSKVLIENFVQPWTATTAFTHTWEELPAIQLVSK